MHDVACEFGCAVKARLHRRFLSRQLDAIFLAAKLHQDSNQFETPAISRRQFALKIAPSLVSFRIEYKVLILTYKAIHGHAPPYISDLIRTRERTNYNLRSSSQLLLQPYNAAKTKKDIGRQSISSCVSGTVERSPK